MMLIILSATKYAKNANKAMPNRSSEVLIFGFKISLNAKDKMAQALANNPKSSVFRKVSTTRAIIMREE